MYSCKYLLFMTFLLCLTACGNNLIPSGEDKRPTVAAGSTGGAVSQKAPDFSVPATNGTTVTLASSIAGKKGAVYYFTMWCPICDTHMSSMRSSIIPYFPDVNFYLVDYLSGSVDIASRAASENGYAGGDFITLADISTVMTNNFTGTMGTTVVVDSTGTVMMNEDYKDGTKLYSILAALK